MKIKSITTKHITEPQFAGLVETPYPFTPFYQCKIVSDSGNATGRGETAFDAVSDALENLKDRESIKVQTAYVNYLSEHGAHFIDC